MIALAFRSPPPAKYVAPPTLSDRLNQIEEEMPPAKKTDRLPEVHLVRTIPITNPEPAASLIAPARDALKRLEDVSLTPPPEAEEDPPRKRKVKAKRERHASANVCSRHGMRKVTTRGGKSWRCRRA